MSISIINASVAGLLTVAGTTTLSGALTSGSTLNTQGITTTGLTVNGNATISGSLLGTTNLQTITTNGLTVNGNTTLTGNLTAGTIVITNTQLGRLSGATSNIQGQLDAISINNLPNTTTGIKNFAVGDFNFVALNTGSFNIGIGTDTMTQTVAGSYNIAIGDVAGGGVLGNNNICIGQDAGGDPFGPTNFNNSTCIGTDSRMTASNQIVLGTNINTVKILGKLDVSGNVLILGNIISGTTTITNAQLGHISGTGSNIQEQFNKISINNILGVTTGIKNFAVGDYILPALLTGSFNIGIGTDVLNQTVSGSNNIAIGKSAGAGVLGSDNITIGSNALMVAPNNFTGSTCIGKDSQISASNQIVLGTEFNTVKVYGKMDISGNVSLSNSTLFLRQPTDGNHTLVYDATSNGPALKGFAGGRLGTTAKGDILTWNTTGTVHTVSLNGTTQCGNIVAMNDNVLHLRASNDTNHTLSYNLTSNGPALKGDYGGRLGSTSKGDILTWNSTAGLHSVAVNGNLNLTNNLIAGATTITNTSLGFLSGATSNIQTQLNNHTAQDLNLYGNINILQNNTTNIQWNGTATTINGITRHGGIVALVDNPLYLKDYTDSNHSLVYNATSDGPALKGYSGGRIGTITKGDILTWTTSGGVNSTTVNGDSYITGNSIVSGSIREVITGHFTNFYRKTNCGTTETFNFQPFHGLYEVMYSLNHDRTTTAFVYVDVVNNVNGGSYVTAVTQGAGITTSIATSTNIFTITSSFTGGLLIINRKMAYP